MKVLKRIYKSDIRSDGSFLFDIVKNYIDEGKEIAYILPSKFAVDTKREEYLNKLTAISNIKFFTFDSFRNLNLNKRPIDNNITKRFLFENLQSNDYKYIKNTSGMVDYILNFIRKAREDQIQIKALNNDFFNELIKIYQDYLKFLEGNNLSDLLENFKLKEEVDLLVVDGFFSIKNLDFELIEKYFENIDTLVNVPYYINDYFFNEGLINSFIDIGFEPEDRFDDRNFSDLVEDLSKKIKIVESDSQYARQRDLVKLVKGNIENIDIINFSSEDLDLREYLAIEKISINGQKNTLMSVNLIKEIVILLKYMADRSRSNLLKRLKLVYFPLGENPDDLLEEFKSLKFRDYDELHKLAEKSIDLNYIQVDDFYGCMEKLNKKLEAISSFSNYCGLVDGLLDKASEVVLKIYENGKDEELFINNNKAIRELRRLLDNFRKYDNYFEKIDINAYIEMLEDDLNNIYMGEINYNDPSIYKIDQTLCVKYKKTVLEGLDMNYPDYKDNDPIFNLNNRKILEDFNFEYIDSDEIYKRSLLRLLKLIINSDEVYIVAYKESKDFSVLLSIFKDIQRIKIDKISSEKELGLSIISDLKNKLLDRQKFDEYYKYSDFENINRKIINEENRKINQDIKINSDSLDKIKDIVLNRNFHATDFDYYIKSPYAFLYGRLVGIEEIDDKSKEYINMGILYHSVLEEYFKRNKDSFNENDLERIVKTNIKDIFDRDIDPNLILDRIFFENIYENLKDFIEMDIDTRKGNIPSSFEEDFELNLNNIKVRGRIDRIDDLNGQKIITDYKSSSSASMKSIREFKSFQMPIYMMAIDNSLELRYGIIKDANYRTVLLIKDGGSKNKNEFSPEEMRDFLDQVEIKMGEIVSRILSGNFTSLDGKYDQSAFESMLREARY